MIIHSKCTQCARAPMRATQLSSQSLLSLKRRCLTTRSSETPKSSERESLRKALRDFEKLRKALRALCKGKSLRDSEKLWEALHCAFAHESVNQGNTRVRMMLYITYNIYIYIYIYVCCYMLYAYICIHCCIPWHISMHRLRIGVCVYIYIYIYIYIYTQAYILYKCMWIAHTDTRMLRPSWDHPWRGTCI